MFSPDGKRLASWGGDYGVSDEFVFWDAATGKAIRRGVLPRAWLDAWAWMPDGRLLAVVEDGEHQASLYDLNAAKIEGRLLPEQDPGQDRRYAISPTRNLLAFSRDGREGGGYSLRFLDVSLDRPVGEVREVRAARGPLEYTTITRVTPDGRTLIAFTPLREPSGNLRFTAAVWDVETATVRRQFTLPDDAFGSSQADDVSNEQLALALGDGRVLLYDLGSGHQAELPEVHTAPDLDRVAAGHGGALVRLSRDGRTLVTAGGDHRIRLWDRPGRKKLREFAWDMTLVKSMDVSPDAMVLALGGGDGSIRMLSLSTGAEIFSQRGHQRGLVSVSVSTDGRLAATTGGDRTVRIWDLEKGQESRVITCEGRLNSGVWTPDKGSFLAVVYRDLEPEHAVLRGWNAATGEGIHGAGPIGTLAESVQIAPDGRTLFSLTRDTVTMWSWPQGRRLRDMVLPKGDVEGFKTDATLLAISPDGGLMATMVRYVNRSDGRVYDASGGSLDLWDASSGKLVRRLAGSSRRELAAFTASGELLITSNEALWGKEVNRESPRGVLHVLDGATGRLKRMVQVPAPESATVALPNGRSVSSLAVSPDGRTVYLGMPEGTIHACEVATGGVRYDLTGHHGRVMALTMVPGGRRLVSACEDATALVWDLSIPAETAPGDFGRAWDDLASPDASTAYKALASLVATPGRKIPLLAERLAATRPEPDADVPTSARLREIRCLEFLEYLGTPEARSLLASLARGDATAPRTREAVVSLRRLERK